MLGMELKLCSNYVFVFCDRTWTQRAGHPRTGTEGPDSQFGFGCFEQKAQLSGSILSALCFATLLQECKVEQEIDRLNSLFLYLSARLLERGEMSRRTQEQEEAGKNLRQAGGPFWVSGN